VIRTGFPESPSVPVFAFPLAGVRVLVVDDTPDSLDLLTVLLRIHGAAVRTALSAYEAFDLFSAESPDVLISDIGMPGENGYSLLRKVRTLEAHEDRVRTPAVALTGYAHAEERAESLAAGFQAHVAKPVDPEDLVMLVQTLVRG
jgi:CheY-like chemotaxis protein